MNKEKIYHIKLKQLTYEEISKMYPKRLIPKCVIDSIIDTYLNRVIEEVKSGKYVNMNNIVKLEKVPQKGRKIIGLNNTEYVIKAGNRVSAKAGNKLKKCVK